MLEYDPYDCGDVYLEEECSYKGCHHQAVEQDWVKVDLCRVHVSVEMCDTDADGW